MFVVIHQTALRMPGPEPAQHWIVWCLIFAMMSMRPFVEMAYSASHLFVTASAPSAAHLGSVNGFAQSVVALVRALGPACANWAFAESYAKGWLGGYGVFWGLCLLAAGSLGLARLLPENPKSKVGAGR